MKEDLITITLFDYQLIDVFGICDIMFGGKEARRLHSLFVYRGRFAIQVVNAAKPSIIEPFGVRRA